jgi:peptidyl-prolyl cis-trans isomerase SurA
MQSLSEMKSELEEKVRKDERSLLITNSLSKKLRVKYTYSKVQKTLSAIKKVVNDDFYNQTWEVPTNAKDNPSEILVINKSKKVSSLQFLNFIYSQQKAKLKIKPVAKLVDELFEKFIDEQLNAYYNENLENEFPEFKYVMEEYRDGLLLFDLMDKEIWTKAKTDTLGINTFFKNNAKNYFWKKRYKVDILSSTDKLIIEKVQNFLKKGKSVDYIKEKLNQEGKINVMVKSGLFEEDYDILPNCNNLSIGNFSIVQKEAYYFIVNVLEIKEAGEKEFNDCKGKVISDYQQYLENNWVSELKKEFEVKINQEVFNKVKQQLHQ